MDPQNPQTGDVHLFGHTVSREKEHKFLMIAGMAGIAAFVLMIYNQHKAAASGSSSQPTSAAGSGAGTGTASSSSGSTPQSNPLTTIELKFSEGNQAIATHGGASSGSGSAGLNVLGLFSLGGGGSKGGNNQSAVGVNNTFSADTTIQTADPSVITQAEEWLAGLAGSQDQRASQEQSQLNTIYPIINPGHTLQGVTTMESAQQAVYNQQHGLAGAGNVQVTPG